MCNSDDDFEILPVPVDSATLSRLARLARDAGTNPLECAGALLRDLLIDDERAHGQTTFTTHKLNS
jgi:hypothetical protein